MSTSGPRHEEMTEPTPLPDPMGVVGDIRHFLLGAEALPTPHGTALKLMEFARDPDTPITEILRVIQSDPALTGFVLRAASAARFHGANEGLDLRRSVLRLGLDTIRSRAVALSLVNQRGRTPCAGFDYPGFWLASLHTGILMESLSLYCEGLDCHDNFSLGLLGSIGRLAFATAAPVEYARLLERAPPPHDDIAALERAAFGFDHHELSSVLLADWGIPTVFAEVVYWQSDPEGGNFTPGSRQHLLASALQLATSLSRLTLGATPPEGEHEAAALRAAILGLPESTMRAIVSESLPQLSDWARLVGLPAPTTHPLHDSD